MAILDYRRTLLVAALATAALASIVMHPHAIDAHAQDTMADETQHSEAGVMAVDNHWSIAEMTGDTDWLDQMLLPEYRSVGNTGTVHPKAAIVAGAAKRKGTDLAKAKLEFATYQKEHPYGSAVVIHGDTAVITFYDPSLGPDKGVKSSDVFVYVDGHWHAIYSQHTAVNAG
ncbi:nuclear transport factor 2 family protein [Dyella psychrodurans]|nr:nuclear transport factor 2 family protein [Dyella psychrodurans]